MVEQWNVTFPKPKPDLAQKPIESEGKTFTVLQLSDWHIDPEYQVNKLSLKQQKNRED